MICKKCGVDKELQYFAKDKKLKSGYNCNCRECQNAIRRINQKIKKRKDEASKNRIIKNTEGRDNSNKCNECKFSSISKMTFTDGTNSIICTKHNKFIAFIEKEDEVISPEWCW